MSPDFQKHPLVTAIAQDISSGRILMVAHMDEEAFTATQKTGEAHFHSRSRNRLWKKGEQSGNVLSVKSMELDCDRDALILHVEPAGPACHTGEPSCFFTSIPFEGLRSQPSDSPATGDAIETKQGSSAVLAQLAAVISQRHRDPGTTGYTGYLFSSGLDKILKKVGEEAAEVIIAAKNGNPDEIIPETADLIYHLLVMLEQTNVDLSRVYGELAKRRDSGAQEDQDRMDTEPTMVGDNT